MITIPRSFLFLLAFPAIAMGFDSSPATAASANLKDVCTSGCTYSSVQSAIDSITDSSASNVYTVFIDSGVLSPDNSITTNGKSYINFEGRGLGVSVLQASRTWFSNAATSSNFFDLSSSTNITIKDLTIDARTLDPGGLRPSVAFTGVSIGTGADKVVFDGCEVQGLVYGIWDTNATAGNLVQMFHSKVRGVNAGVAVAKATWHVFSSDIRAIRYGGESGHDVSVVAIAFETGGDSANVTLWGSHLHGESGEAAQTYPVAGLQTSFSTGSLVAIGTTIHVKMTTANVGSAARDMYAVRLTHTQTATRFIDLIGCQLLYESPTGLSQGNLAGIGYPAVFASNQGVEVRLVGTSVIDGGGSGASFRADIVGAPTMLGQTRYEPTIKNIGSKIVSAVSSNANALTTSNAALYNTVNVESGTVAFPASNTVAVTLPTAMPDTNYRIALSANAQETVYVTTKTTTSFTLKSSNAGSTASVDWVTTR